MAPEWPIDQIALHGPIGPAHNLYELEHAQDVPLRSHKRGHELAKAFGGDNSSKFVNGVLGTLLRQKEESESNASTKARPRAKN